MWSYKTTKQEVDANSNREKMLDVRAKKSRDKHCWI